MDPSTMGMILTPYFQGFTLFSQMMVSQILKFEMIQLKDKRSKPYLD
jgi:hypothetical protein